MIRHKKKMKHFNIYVHKSVSSLVYWNRVLTVRSISKASGSRSRSTSAARQPSAMRLSPPLSAARRTCSSWYPGSGSLLRYVRDRLTISLDRKVPFQPAGFCPKC